MPPTPDPARARARAEWLTVLALAGVVDYIRSRGEADGDTFSEVVRDVGHLESFPGRVALAVALAGLWRHLTRKEVPA